jgi:hypothetical protein
MKALISDRYQTKDLVFDFCMVILCGALALVIRFGDALRYEKISYRFEYSNNLFMEFDWSNIGLFALAYTALYVACCYLITRMKRYTGPEEKIRGITIAAIVTSVIAVFIFFLIRPLNFPISTIILASLFFICAQFLFRVALLATFRDGPQGSAFQTLRRFPVFINSFLTLLSIIICIGALEIFLRTYNPFYFTVRSDKIVLRRNFQEKLVNPNPIPGRWDPVLDRRWNSLGLRGEEPPANLDDYLSIVTIGGSTTIDIWLSEGKTWSDQLNLLLKQKFSKLWLNNAGLFGHSTYGHIIMTADYMAKIKPDIILYYVGLNDFLRDISMPDMMKDYDTKKNSERNQLNYLGQSLVQHTEIGALFMNLIGAYSAWAFDIPPVQTSTMLGSISRQTVLEYMGVTENDLRDSDPKTEMEILQRVEANLGKYESRLRRLITISREIGSEPVLITQAMLFGSGKDDVTGLSMGRIPMQVAGMETTSGVFWKAIEMYNDVTRRIGHENGLLVIDAARMMPKSQRFYYSYAHFVNEGAKVAAGIFFSKLCGHLERRFPEHSDEISCESVLSK